MGIFEYFWVFLVFLSIFGYVEEFLGVFGYLVNFVNFVFVIFVKRRYIFFYGTVVIKFCLSYPDARGCCLVSRGVFALLLMPKCPPAGDLVAAYPALC